MKKVLAIDARMIGPIRHGIASYVEGIAKSFKDGDALTDTLVQSIGAKNLSEVDVVFLVHPETPATSPVYNFKTVVMNVSCYHPKSWLEVPKVLKGLGAKLFFNPTFASYPYLPCPFIQTVHDLNHLHFGSFFQKLYYQNLLKTSMKEALWVFTVSKTIKDELVKWSKISPEKIKVFYNLFDPKKSIDEKTVETVLAKYNLSKNRYFLCISNDKPHKNLDMLMGAYAVYANLMKTPFERTLTKNSVVENWSRIFAENAKTVGATDAVLPLVVSIPKSTTHDSENILRIGNIGDEILSVLLQNCAGFYFPSLYEGFGRPPVEAAINGAKFIVVSDIPVHREAQGFSDTPFRFAKV